MSNLCECGCGQPAGVYASGSGGRYRKGDPKRFIRGHNARLRKPKPMVNTQGYVTIAGHNDHPRADVSGRIREHLLIAERALGRPVPEGSPVHHVNGDPADNRPSNLVICEDQAYHMLLHARQRALDACGNADWRQCRICGAHDDPENLRISDTHCVHPECHAEYMREYRERAA